MKELKPTYTNDRKAPRMGKAKYSNSVITKELWRSFKKTYPEYKNKTWAEFVNEWDEIAETIRFQTAHNPLGVKLGSYTGELKYQYLPLTFQPIDKHTSELVGEPIPHLNIITKGKVGKVVWERKWAVRFNKMLQFFGFESHRKIDKLIKDVNPDQVRSARIR